MKAPFRSFQLVLQQTIYLKQDQNYETNILVNHEGKFWVNKILKCYTFAIDRQSRV